MIIEVRVGRTWQIWIDGMKSNREWAIGEEEIGGDHAETYHRYEIDGCEIGGRQVESIAFDVPQEDWVMDYGARLGPTEMWITIDGEAHYLQKVYCWYKREDDWPTLGVQLESGEWIEIDEIQAYIRAEDSDG